MRDSPQFNGYKSKWGFTAHAMMQINLAQYFAGWP
jgi:hypothetical protein